MRRVRVVLVEDNEVFRDALELLLGMRDDVEVVASVGDGAAAVTAAIEHRPAVACLTKDQELEEIVAAIQNAAAVG
jgi:DNA-binding NarL/FixJ family response regulator